MGKKAKRKAHEMEEEEEDTAPPGPPITRDSDLPRPKRSKWKNRQRCLVFGTRGMSYRNRHLMENLRSIMPHSRKEVKKEKKDDLHDINEIAEMKNCNKVLYFEAKKKKDLYLWLSEAPHGPSIKFLVLNIHTMGELKLTGNCLRGSRPLLSFDPAFDSEPHWHIMKEMFVQTFGIPNYHPKSQPFHDHVYTFTILDGKIWFRNYEVLSTDGKLSEIGPRFVLFPIKVFDGSFGGETLWENSDYISPNKMRSAASKKHVNKFETNYLKKKVQESRPPAVHLGDPSNDVFQTGADDDE